MRKVFLYITIVLQILASLALVIVSKTAQDKILKYGTEYDMSIAHIYMKDNSIHFSLDRVLFYQKLDDFIKTSEKVNFALITDKKGITFIKPVEAKDLSNNNNYVSDKSFYKNNKYPISENLKKQINDNFDFFNIFIRDYYSPHDSILNKNHIITAKAKIYKGQIAYTGLFIDGKPIDEFFEIYFAKYEERFSANELLEPYLTKDKK